MANINIGGRLHSVATGNIVAGADEIFDDSKGKKQSDINAENEINEVEVSVDENVGTPSGSATFNNNKLSLAFRNILGDEIESMEQTVESTESDGINVFTVTTKKGKTATFRVRNGSKGDTVIIGEGVEYTLYNDIGSNTDGAMTQYATTKAIAEVMYDISAVNGGTTYASLSAALGENGSNIPENFRKGGMSVRFVQSSDNKYVQYRLMTKDFSTNKEDWQNVIYIKESAHYIFTLVDSEDNMVIGVTKEGKLICDENFLSLALAKPLSLKVDVSSIVDNLTTERVDVPLSAKQGFTLKGLIDTLNTALGITNERVSEIESGVTFITSDKYLIAIIDSEEKVLWGIKRNGELDEPTRLEESVNWLFVLTDVKGNVVFGIKKNGDIYAPGLSFTNYDEDITELQSSVAQIQDDVSDLTDAIENFEVPEDTIEVANGKLKSYGTYESELSASPLVDNSSDYNIGFKTIGKDKTLHTPQKAFIVFNHDDGHPNDLVGTRKIYNKYGFKGSICAVFGPFSSLSSAKTLVSNYKKWLNDGHEIGLHAIMNGSYWYYDRLYDVRPDGSTSFAPLISELRGSNGDGTGTNTFGTTISTATTIRNAGYDSLFLYDTPNLDAKVVEATQSQLDDVNRGLCFYGDRYLISGLEDLDIPDIMKATSAASVSKTRLQWLEYYYNRLVEEVGYSSTSSDIAARFEEDYDYPSGSTAAAYYPDAEHLINGKMVYYGDTTNPHYSDLSYQKVGKFTKGLFKGCFSCCNWEVMDKVVTCAEAFFRYYYGLNHFVDMHRHGVAYTSLLYVLDGIHYLERSYTILNDSHKKFYVSHRNAWLATVDVMNEHGIDLLKENVPRNLLDTDGQIGYFYGQQGIKSSRGFGGTATSMGSYTNYLAMFGSTRSGMETMSYTDFMAFMSGVDNWFKFCYENGGQSITRNGLTMNVYNYIKDIANEAIGCLGTGKVLALSVDTINNSPAITMAVDLILRFFKDNGIEVLNWGSGKEKILSEERYTGGNIFPNAGFNQTLLQYLGGSSTRKDAYIPDGWFYISNGGSETYSVTKETVNGNETKVFAIAGKASVQTNIYGLPQGSYKLTYDVKSSDNGNTSFKYSKVGYKWGVYTTIDDYTHTSEWVTKEVDFSIDAPHRNFVDETNPISVISDGYEDNINRLVFRLNSNSASNVLKLANVKLYKNN